MADWSFLTSHARVLLCIAHDPGVRLRDIAARTGVTERTAYGIVTDLTEAGYVVKHKDGRRNRYQIQAHLPLPETDSRERTIGEFWLSRSPPTMKQLQNSGHSPYRATAPPAPAPITPTFPRKRFVHTVSSQAAAGETWLIGVRG